MWKIIIYTTYTDYERSTLVQGLFIHVITYLLGSQKLEYNGERIEGPCSHGETMPNKLIN